MTYCLVHCPRLIIFLILAAIRARLRKRIITIVSLAKCHNYMLIKSLVKYMPNKKKKIHAHQSKQPYPDLINMSFVFSPSYLFFSILFEPTYCVKFSILNPLIAIPTICPKEPIIVSIPLTKHEIQLLLILLGRIKIGVIVKPRKNEIWLDK